MPSTKDTESTSTSTHRRRRKHHDSESGRDKDSPRKDKDKERRKSRSSRKTSSKDGDQESTTRHSHRTRSTTSSQSRSTTHKMTAVPELERRAATASPNASRISLPYPNFSKAHSKESVLGKENTDNPRLSLYTPDPTDLGNDQPKGAETTARDGDASQGLAPPSPPLTAADPEVNGTGSVKRDGEGTKIDAESLADTTGSQATSDFKYSVSRSTVRNGSALDDTSQLTADTEPSRASTVREKSSRTAAAQSRPLSPHDRPPGATNSALSENVSAIRQSGTDSEATSIAPQTTSSRQQSSLLSNNDSSIASTLDSSTHSPQTNDAHLAARPDRKQTATPVIEVFPVVDSTTPAARQSFGGPPPPPPPPPAMTTAPRVDYLLQNGGLPYPVPRNLTSAAGLNASPRTQGAAAASVQAIFSPFQNLLENYNQVLTKHGSIAVATGYRSVARRLLDRLEAVFARNISSEMCHCIMCNSVEQSTQFDAEETGVSWGEILEYVSGRRELPPWPPFSIANSNVDLGILGLNPKPPMQTLDIDVPEEYREHYIRQSKKTKHAVRNWLASQPDDPSSPPQEVDDETLTFAILTHLEPEKRPLFTALMRGLSTLPVSRTVTPLNAPKAEMLAKTALALQRLYRLARPPRDAESTIYLLNNPEMHGMLATLAAVSNGEWEILISGRFDGFLWSGAENPSGFPAGRGPSRTPQPRSNTPSTQSRGPTPFSPMRAGAHSRGPTPAPGSFGAPVQMDEEMEIAVLAEVEREIYSGMEALEDAFEALHCKAEVVRRALRERSAGLAMAAQARRGSEVEVRMGTPASISGGWGDRAYDSETDDGFDDGRSELAPDDSASNISYNRRRRPHRRTERQTPAPVEEEDESDLK